MSTAVTIPDSVTSIGEGVFSGCSGLTELTLPHISSYALGYYFGVTSYNGSTAVNQYYKELGTAHSRYYYIPNGLKKVTVTRTNSIPYGAFYNCKNIEEIVLNEEITEIGDNAFYGCTALYGITIPKNTEKIGSSAFYNCAMLENIVIPNTVAFMGERVFYGCSNLSEITLSEKLSEITDRSDKGV